MRSIIEGASLRVYLSVSDSTLEVIPLTATKNALAGCDCDGDCGGGDCDCGGSGGNDCGGNGDCGSDD